MTKIAIIEPYRFIPAINGGHKACFYFAKSLSKKIETYCISTSDNSDYNRSFQLVKLFNNVKLKYLNPVVAIKIRKWCKENRITHIFLNQPFMGILIYYVAKSLSIPFFIYVHNIEFKRFDDLGKWWSKGLFWLEKWVYPKADALFFISDDELIDALEIFNLDREKCFSLPYGTMLFETPEVSEERYKIRSQLGILEDTFLIIFFAPMDYLPNLQALEVILKEINPLLLQNALFNYQFIICGGGLPSQYENLESYETLNVKYLGFVEDIQRYVQSADVMINPITKGGGVKIKVLEALAWGTTVLSSKSGAKGIDQKACGKKLLLVEDNDWDNYIQLLIQIQQEKRIATPRTFYQKYNWKNIINDFLINVQGLTNK